MAILKQNADDLKDGQVVLVTARWILVITGLILSLWNPQKLSVLRIQVLVIFGLAFANFYLQTELNRNRLPKAWIVYLTSLFDLVVITLIVLIQQDIGGFESPTFAFYFPAIMAYAVALPTVLTIIYTGGVVSLYFLIGLVGAYSNNPSPDAIVIQILLIRVLMLVAVAFSGNLYKRLEANRREEAEEAEAFILDQLRRAKADES